MIKTLLLCMQLGGWKLALSHSVVVLPYRLAPLRIRFSAEEQIATSGSKKIEGGRETRMHIKSIRVFSKVHRSPRARLK